MRVRWEWEQEGTHRPDVAVVCRNVADAKDAGMITYPKLGARVFGWDGGR